jgi:hypothetical protein
MLASFLARMRFLPTISKISACAGSVELKQSCTVISDTVVRSAGWGISPAFPARFVSLPPAFVLPHPFDFVPKYREGFNNKYSSKEQEENRGSSTSTVWKSMLSVSTIAGL